MEHKRETRISLTLTDAAERDSRQAVGIPPIEAFLQEIGGGGRRFSIVCAGRLGAELYGTLTKPAAALLREEIEDFLLLRCLDGEGDAVWQVELGREIPPERELFEDGERIFPQNGLLLTFREEWTATCPLPPTETFLTLLTQELHALPQVLTRTPSHLRLLAWHGLSVARLWEAGHSVLRRMDALEQTVLFDVRRLLPEESDNRGANT